MKRIYIAGKYSAGTVIDVLNNIREGIKQSAYVLKSGAAPFCPWLDFMFQFFEPGLTIDDYYGYSMAWLEAADELWVLPGSEDSKGTQAEVARARELEIPIRYL